MVGIDPLVGRHDAIEVLGADRVESYHKTHSGDSHDKENENSNHENHGSRPHDIDGLELHRNVAPLEGMESEADDGDPTSMLLGLAKN